MKTTDVVVLFSKQQQQLLLSLWTLLLFGLIMLFRGGRPMTMVVAADTDDKKNDHVVHFKDHNFRVLSLGKHVFVKIFDPRKCKKCPDVHKAFRRLAHKYQNNKNVIIGEINGAYGGIDNVSERLCSDYGDYKGHRGLAVHYGDPALAQLYKGDLDFDSLEEFLKKKNLNKPFCSVADVDTKCDWEQQRIIETLTDETDGELRARMKAVEDKLEKIEQIATKKYPDMSATALTNKLRNAALKVYKEHHWNYVRDIMNERHPELDDDGYEPEDGHSGWTDDEDEDDDGGFDFGDEDEQGWGEESHCNSEELENKVSGKTCRAPRL